jgi:hypothetical protein
MKLNSYAYAENRPVLMKDPSGLNSQSFAQYVEDRYVQALAAATKSRDPEWMLQALSHSVGRHMRDLQSGRYQIWRVMKRDPKVESVSLEGGIENPGKKLAEKQVATVKELLDPRYPVKYGQTAMDTVQQLGLLTGALDDVDKVDLGKKMSVVFKRAAQQHNMVMGILAVRIRDIELDLQRKQEKLYEQYGERPPAEQESLQGKKSLEYKPRIYFLPEDMDF